MDSELDKYLNQGEGQIDEDSVIDISQVMRGKDFFFN